MLVSALIHDKDGNALGHLRDNEWQIAPSHVWDMEACPQHATIRHAPRDIAFSVDIRNDQLRLRGNWYFQGMPIRFSEKEVTVGTNQGIISSEYSRCLISVG